MKLPAMLLAGGVLLLAVSPAIAQQTTIGMRNQRVGHSFYERQGVNFGFNLGGGRDPYAPGAKGVFGLRPDGTLTPSIEFRQGSFGAAAPTAGGYAPNTGAQSGFQVGNGQGNAFFGLDFAQGSTSSNTTVAPSVTVMNGGTGSIFSGIQRPFVTGVTPVVSGFGPGFVDGSLVPRPSALQQRLQQAQAEGGLRLQSRSNAEDDTEDDEPHLARQPVEPTAADRSSAEQPAESLAAIRARQAAGNAAEQAEAEAWFARAEAAAASGKTALAKAYYRNASNTATGELRKRALEKLQELQPSRR